MEPTLLRQRYSGQQALFGSFAVSPTRTHIWTAGLSFNFHRFRVVPCLSKRISLFCTRALLGYTLLFLTPPPCEYLLFSVSRF